MADGKASVTDKPDVVTAASRDEIDYVRVYQRAEENPSKK